MYEPSNWYWIVAGSTTHVYSSQMASYLEVTDASYAAWLAAGNIPSRIADEADLQQVLAEQYPAGWMPNLYVYANEKQWALATGGFTTNVNSQTVTFPTDTASQILMTGKTVRLTQADPPTVINWQFPTGFMAIPVGDFAPAATKVADFVQATFDALDAIFGQITAGTISATAQVDAFAWPANNG